MTPVDDPRVLQDFVPNDLRDLPGALQGLPARAADASSCPRSWPAGADTTTAVSPARSSPPPARSISTRLARLLHLSAGVVRTIERADGRRYLFRAAGSAGGRFPLELYVAARGVEGLRDGVHWYDPARVTRCCRSARRRRARRRRSSSPASPGAPAGGTPSAASATSTGTRARCSRRPLAVADDAGCPRLRTVFPDAAVTRLVGADGTQEFPRRARRRSATARRRSGPRGEAAVGAVDSRPPLEFPLVTQAQHAGDGDDARRSVACRRPSRGRAAAVRRRSTTSSFGAARRASWTPPARCRATSSSGRSPPRCAGAGCRTSSPFTPSTDSRPASTAGPTSQRRLAAATCATSCSASACDQDLGRDAAFVVIAAADPDAARRPRLPRGPARRRASSRAACTWPPTRSGSARRG